MYCFRTLWLMLSHSLAYQERFHTLLVEGLSNNSSSASTSSVKHQAAEIIRKANTTGGSAKLMQLTNGQRVSITLCTLGHHSFTSLTVTSILV